MFPLHPDLKVARALRERECVGEYVALISGSNRAGAPDK